MVEDHFEVNTGNVCVSRVFAKLKSMTQLQAELKSLKLTIEYNGSANQYIKTDERRLTQVLLNLTCNAIKYTFEGEIRVIGTTKPNGKLSVVISDTGIGIEEGAVSELFELFASIERKAKTKQTGIRGRKRRRCRHGTLPMQEDINCIGRDFRY